MARLDPTLRSQAEREFKIASALREDGPAPSLALLSSIERQVREARAPAAARRTRRSWGIRPAFLVAAAGIAAAVVLVAVLTVRAGGPSTGQSLNRAAGLAYRSPVAPPPGAQSPTLLAVSYHGVTFPNYGHRFGSNPTGERTDTIDGHSVLTVFYRLRDGTRLSYSVFAGSPVSVPSGAANTALRACRFVPTGRARASRSSRSCATAAHASSPRTARASERCSRSLNGR